MPSRNPGLDDLLAVFRLPNPADKLSRINS